MLKIINILEKIRSKFRYGLVLHFLQSRLKSIGIEIFFYYWVQEELHDEVFPEFENNLNGYTFEFFGPEEMKVIGNIPDREDATEEKLLLRLKEGNKCFGAKYQGQIAAFTWFDFTGKSLKDHQIHLNDQEAYLFDMYTMKPFRGKNIAPYIRYQCYKILKEMGRDKFYSTSDVTNTPSVKFKKKLRAKFLRLYLDIRLFNKFHWNWKIKEYKN